MHCSNNANDRNKGAYWERQFCLLASDCGMVFTPMQLGRTKSASAYSRVNGEWNIYTLPDITIWTSPGQHHEIKHKEPTFDNCFGLEVYRFDRLLDFANVTKQSVYYTIHNHKLNGGTDCRENRIEHWFTVDIRDLCNSWETMRVNGVSWVNGERRENIHIYYWKSELWYPLSELWELVTV